MGADVMRWQYCAQPPDRDLLFGFGPGHEIKRKLLTLWNSVAVLRPLREHRRLGADARRPRDRPAGRAAARPLARRRARTQFVHEATAAYEATLTVDVMRAFEAFVEDLSNWYIRRSRPRFWAEDDDAFRTLWYALVQSLRAVAPVMPFLTEHLWLNLVAGRAGRRSTSPAGPTCPSPTAPLLDEIAECAAWSSSAARRARPRG